MRVDKFLFCVISESILDSKRRIFAILTQYYVQLHTPSTDSTQFPTTAGVRINKCNIIYGTSSWNSNNLKVSELQAAL